MLCKKLSRLKMDLMWILPLCLNQAATVTVSYVIIVYLKHKPLGQQTLFDLLLHDLLIVVIFSTSVFSSVIFLSRFHAAFPAIFLPPNLIFTKVLCLTYYFSYVVLCINQILTFILRIISVFFVGYLVMG